MRKYSLADRKKRDSVDLRDYEDVIVKAVLEFSPAATVTVRKDHYLVNKPLTQSQSVRIGRKICESALSQYCVQITLSKLFIGKEVVYEKRKQSKQIDRHH